MSEETGNGSFVKGADRKRVVEVLMNLPLEGWARISDSSSYNTAALFPFGVNVSCRPGVTEEIHELSFFYASNHVAPPDRIVYRGEDVRKLYERLLEGDRQGQIIYCKNMQEMTERTA